ncbi:MAG: AAA family ATPase [Rhizobacter sp.]|nr:AAA family ATPase [Rhizobacter sp.]
MKLVKAHITNFRSVLDTGEFKLGGVTCLVGKNESGKTTVLQALERINPVDKSKKKFDKDLEYPRGHLAEYEERHPGGEATVISTTWTLDDEDVTAVEAELGEGCFRSRNIVVYKKYGEEGTTWTVPLDEPQIVLSLLTRFGVKAAEKKQLSTPTVKELAAKVAGLAEASDEAKAAAAEVAKFRKGSAHCKAIDVLDEGMPEFLYFSSYDRMDGRVQLEALEAARANKTLSAGQQIFQDFLDFAGTSAQELQSATTFEKLKAKVEAASISISKQVFAYWSQNKNLKVEFSLEAGRSGDPTPFNTGQVMHTRIRNKVHDMTVPFDDRSAGFTWFFSFLVKFSQVQKRQGNVIILLDEPGLNLHAKAQSDLLRYFKEKLEPKHQVIYTTHSPFMVPTDNILSVRTVEDVVVYRQGEEPEVLGTKVGDDVLSTDRDTLFPLQGALGYELSQSLFVGEHTLLVEGPSDVLYLQAFSNALKALGRKHLDPRWTLCPAGGVDKVWAFVSLFGGNKLHVAALIDYANGQKNSVEKLRKSQLLRDGHVLLATDFCGQAEADTEDLLGEDLFLELVNGAYAIAKAQKLAAAALPAGPGANLRIVPKVEAAMKLVASAKEFDHFQQASWLIQNPTALDATRHAAAFDRFEQLFVALNKLLV